VLSVRRRNFPDGERLDEGFLQSSPQSAQLGDMYRVERANRLRWLLMQRGGVAAKRL
jgi:hypothetical protein